LAIDSLVSNGSTIIVDGTMTSSTIFIDSGGSLEVTGDLKSLNLTVRVPVTIYGNSQVGSLSVTGASINLMGGLISDYVLVDGGASLNVASSFYGLSFPIPLSLSFLY
jgi:hypothetical protein